MDPQAERKKQTPAKMSERLRPSLLAKRPESELPIIHPISALEEVNPCITSVYSKSPAPLKNACKPFSAPDITAVS